MELQSEFEECALLAPFFDCEKEQNKPEMKRCCLTATEHMCVPTQWFVVDATGNHRYVDLIKQTKGAFGSVDYIRVPWFLDDENDVDEADDNLASGPRSIYARAHKMTETELKQQLVQMRPVILEHLHATFNQRRRGGPTLPGGGAGTRGRLVVFVVGDLANPLSRLLLEELPLDLTAFIHWKLGLHPALVRCALGGGALPQDRNSFLAGMERQYFNAEERLARTPAHVRAWRTNDFDTCILGECEDRFKEVMARLLALHVADMQIIGQQVSRQHLAPGEVLVMDPTYRWRRVNWFALAQPDVVPRLWRFTNDPGSDESEALLDLLDGTRKIAQGGGGLQLRREANWQHLGLVEEVYTRPYTLCEEDEYRVTAGDERTRRELIHYLQKTKLYEESLLQIRKVREQWAITTRDHADDATTAADQQVAASAASPARLRKTVSAASLHLYSSSSSSANPLLAPDRAREEQAPQLPIIYLKLEGMALLQLAREEESRALLQQYIGILLRREETEGQLSLAHSHEIATLALYEKDLPLARKYALKAIHADKTHIPSYKTLVRVIQQTGESTHAEEELAFSFFVQLLHDSRQAEDYYRYMQEHWPRAYFALAYQGLFLSEVKAKLAGKPQDRDICLREAEHAFRQAARILAAKDKLDAKDGWILGSFATFLFQHRYAPGELGREATLEIENLYWRALSADADNLVWHANLSGFLLSCGRRREGLDMLDEQVIPRLSAEEDKDSALGLEAWFYVLCYAPERRGEAIDHLRGYLNAGARSHGWDLALHVEHAKREGDHEAVWLERLSQVITQDASVAMLDMWPLWNPSIVCGPSAAANSPQQQRGRGLPDEDLLATYSPSPRKRDGPQYVRRKRNHDDTAATSASQDTELGAADGRQRSLKLRFRQPMHRDEDEDEDDGHTSVVALGPRPHAGGKAKREDDEEEEEEAEREERKGPEAKAHRPQTQSTTEESGRTRDILFWSDDDDDDDEDEEGNARGGVGGSKPLSASYTRKRRRPHEGDNAGGGGSAAAEQQRKGLALKRGAPPSPSAAPKKRTLQESAQQKNTNKRAATKTRTSRAHAEEEEEGDTPPSSSSSPVATSKSASGAQAARKRAPKGAAKAPSGGQQQRERKGKKGRAVATSILDCPSPTTTTTTRAKSRHREAPTQSKELSPNKARPTTLARSRSRTRLEKEEAEEERKTRWINPYERMAEEIDEEAAAAAAGHAGYDDDDPEDDPFDFDGHQKRREKALRQEQDELLAFLGKKALPTRRPTVAAPRTTAAAAMKTKTKTLGTASSRGGGGGGRDVFDFDDFGDEHDA